MVAEFVTAVRERGFAELPRRLGTEPLQPIVAEYESDIDERAQRLHHVGHITDLLKGEPFERRLIGLAAQAPAIANRLDIRELLPRSIFDFLHDPTILDIAEEFVGPEIVCHPTQTLRPRLPDVVTGDMKYSAARAGWHQDQGVLQPDSDGEFVLDFWVPLTPATLDNGCLEVLPGSNHLGLIEHQVSPVPPVLAIPDDRLPDIQPTAIPLAPGDLLLMDNYVVHRGRENASATIRWSMDIRYQALGRPTGHPYFPSFVARSRSDPDSVLTDYDRWVAMWREAVAANVGRRPWRWADPSPIAS
jgi:phytanoyl-CoA hydroxylase